jgi:hypothetical protein
MVRRAIHAVALGAMLGACNAPAGTSRLVSRALPDTLLALFDSMVTIHQAVPDTGLIRRMHPSADTIMFVEGPVVHRFTGDSLVRRVAAAHAHVSSMGPDISQREVLILSNDYAMLTGLERVSWTVGAKSNQWEGLLTLVVARHGDRWVIRGYRH